MTTRTAAKLQSHRVPVRFDTIEHEVPGYQGGTKAAQKRAFERDKDELRKLGVPIETEGFLGDNDAAYRIRAEAFYLPYLSVVTERRRADEAWPDGYRALQNLAFEADELEVVVEAAARATQMGDAFLAAEAMAALRRLAFDLPLDAAHPPRDSAIAVPRAAPVPETPGMLH